MNEIKKHNRLTEQKKDSKDEGKMGRGTTNE